MIRYMQNAVRVYGRGYVEDLLDSLSDLGSVSADQSQMEAFGLSLVSDPRRAAGHPEHGKNMPYLTDEQPLMWALLAPFVIEAQLATTSYTQFDFVDIGVGTGPFACWAAAQPSLTRVLGIDANPRALEFCRTNMVRNNLDFELRQQWVEPGTLEDGCTAAAGIWPPYTPYPLSIERHIPLHARGGSDVQGTWRTQIRTVFPALAQNGALIFNQCAPGGPNWNGCQAIAEIADLAPGASVVYTDVYGPIAAAEFISALYGEREPEFQSWWNSTYETFHYVLGAIINDGLGRREVFQTPSELIDPDGWYTGRIPCFQDVMAVTWDHKRQEETGE